MDSFWTNIIQWGVWSLLMMGFFALVARARRRDLAKDFGSEMRMPTYLLIVGVVDIVFFVGIAIFSNLFPNETVTSGTTTAFLLFSALGSVLVYVYFIQRHHLESDHILFTSMFGIRSKIPWSEILVVDYSPGLQWFIIETKDKKRYHFSEILKGIRQFSFVIFERVARAKISDRAVASLERFKMGRIE